MKNESTGILSLIMLVLSFIWIGVVIVALIVAQFYIFSLIDLESGTDLRMFMDETQKVLLYEIILIIVSWIHFKFLKLCIKKMD